MMKSLLVILLAATSVSALTERERQEAHDAMHNPDLYQGDIIGIAPGDRGAVAAVHRWPGAVVPYVIDPSLAHARIQIEDAMQDYHRRTCVKFVRRTIEINYVKIYSGQGCSAHEGLLNQGEQLMSLGPSCLYRGTIIHELGHTLGFFHEWLRSDRDEYLIIHWQNIEKGMEQYFRKYQPHQNLLYNTTFDYNSIMIYSNDAFPKSPGLMTLEARNGQKLIGSYDKHQMTAIDAYRVNRHYNCAV